MSKEAGREVSENIFSSIVNESQPKNGGLSGDKAVRTEGQQAAGVGDSKNYVTEARSDGAGPSFFKDTVVNEDAKKNTQIQKLFFDSGFLARGIWSAPGDATSNMFPQTNRLPVSLVEEGARRMNQFVKDRYWAVKDQLGKDKTDDKLRERIELVRQLKEKINEEAVAVPVARKGDQYLVVDSVEVSKELAAVYYLLHPPQQLHPYLRYLLYTRLVDPQVLRWYLAMTEKINAICKQAKAGKGKIRYRGKIVGTFRPMPYDMGGAYELVVDLPKTEKAQLDKDIFPGQ